MALSPSFVSARAGRRAVRARVVMDPILMAQMVAAFKLSKAVVNQASDEALKAELVSIKAQSQREVPFDTGQLQSAWFERSRVGGRKAEIDFGYDTGIAPYAWIQHEIPFNHANGRKWKYLEDPVTQHSARMGNRIGASLSQHPGFMPISRGRLRSS